MGDKVSEAGPQEEYSQDINLEVDIEKIYKNFIMEIDKIRSHLSVQDNSSLNTITSTSNTTSPATLKNDKGPQESRCHAFYRLLGLPVVGYPLDGYAYYSPGFDKPNNSDQTISDKKLKIAQSIFKNIDLKNMLDERENNPRYYSSIFNSQGVEATILAMASCDLRPFSISFANLTGPLDTNTNHQTYDTELARLINESFSKNLGEDVNDGYYTEPNRTHLLAPLMVDPRIDFNVYPKRNTLAVPFLANKSETKLSDGIFLKRPYIEKVCRDRFDTSDKSIELGESTKAILLDIVNNKALTNDSLIKKATDPNKITSSLVQFTNYINSIRSVLLKLKESINAVNPVLNMTNISNASWNWVPIVNKNGLETLCTTQDILASLSNNSYYFNTQKDQELISLLYQKGLNDISNKLNTVQAPDVGDFAFDNTELTPDNNSSDSIKDLSQARIDDLSESRKKYCDAANQAVRIIEIIMGEFSGLGLIDILAISATFWIMDEADLLGLLDDIAIDRMLLNPNLKAPAVLARKASPPGINISLTNFQNKVTEVYNLVDELWKQITTQSS